MTYIMIHCGTMSAPVGTREPPAPRSPKNAIKDASTPRPTDMMALKHHRPDMTVTVAAAATATTDEDDAYKLL